MSYERSLLHSKHQHKSRTHTNTHAHDTHTQHAHQPQQPTREGARAAGTINKYSACKAHRASGEGGTGEGPRSLTSTKPATYKHSTQHTNNTPAPRTTARRCSLRTSTYGAPHSPQEARATVVRRRPQRPGSLPEPLPCGKARAPAERRLAPPSSVSWVTGPISPPPGPRTKGSPEQSTAVAAGAAEGATAAPSQRRSMRP